MNRIIPQGQNFELLKRTYPISQCERFCDGYKYIINNIPINKRIELNINIDNLQQVINIGEKYIYQVAKDGKFFKTMYLSFSNYEIIRKYHLDNY